jgi:hypothetical protein
VVPDSVVRADLEAGPGQATNANTASLPVNAAIADPTHPLSPDLCSSENFGYTNPLRYMMIWRQGCPWN